MSPESPVEKAVGEAGLNASASFLVTIDKFVGISIVSAVNFRS